MKKLVLSLGMFIVLGASSLFAYNMYGLQPNIIQMASSNGGSEYVYSKSITSNNHGGAETYASIDVYEVPTETPNYVWIGQHMGHKYDDTRIEYNGYIIGYRHYYKFYSVSTGSSSEAMTVKVDGELVDYLTVR